MPDFISEGWYYPLDPKHGGFAFPPSSQKTSGALHPQIDPRKQKCNGIHLYSRTSLWRRRCNKGVKTDSGTLQPGVAVGAAMLTLQVSRQALSSGACLLAPRDCNFIHHVILHRSDTQWWFYGKPCPQHAHKTQNGQSKRRQ